MKTPLIITIGLFYTMLSNAQTINIDSLYFTRNDTIINNDNNRFYCSKLWMSFNGGNKRLLYTDIVNRNIYAVRTFSPRIVKIAYNTSDSIVYYLKYLQEELSIIRVNLDGSTKTVCPYAYDTKEYKEYLINKFFVISDEIIDYLINKHLMLKDIDMRIENKIMALRCYKYEKQVVVFQYDFESKEWTITEDRDLTVSEIDSLGFYKEDYDRAKIEETTKRNKRRKNKNK